MDDNKIICYIKLFILTLGAIVIVLFINDIVDIFIFKWLFGLSIVFIHSYMLNDCVLEYRNKRRS